MSIKICIICGKEFDQNIHNQKYCSKECILKNAKEYRKKYYKEYYKINKSECKERNKKYRKNNKNKSNEYNKKYIKNRRNKDINFRLKCLLRTRLYYALKNNSKYTSTIQLLGCSISELKTHLENQFKQGMTWENHGQWHIDHIIPCCSFDLSLDEEQKKCFHYTNLQPLWAEENLSKGGRFV